MVSPLSLQLSPSRVRYELYSPSSSALSSSLNSSSPHIIAILAYLIERTIARNNRIADPTTQNGKFKVFESNRIPETGIQDFLQMIFEQTQVSPSVLVVAYAYIDRICQFNPQLRVLQSNVHRILITSIMIAAKFVEDLNYRNSYYAKLAGLGVDEMNDLELNFLFLIQFKLRITVNVFESYCLHLEREVSLGGGYQIERTLKVGLWRGKANKTEDEHCGLLLQLTNK